MKYLALITACSVLVFSGCADTRSSARVDGPQSDRCVGRIEDASLEGIQLALNDYGWQMVYPRNVDWREVLSYPPEDKDGLVLPFRDANPDVKWMSHFDSVLNVRLDDLGEEIGRPLNKAEAKEALVRYVSEKVYPVKVSLKAVRDGRKYLLGDGLDFYMRKLEVREHDDGVGLMYKNKF